jgi:tetratricopeptide (TPR) repeat protein
MDRDDGAEDEGSPLSSQGSFSSSVVRFVDKWANDPVRQERLRDEIVGNFEALLVKAKRCFDHALAGRDSKYFLDCLVSLDRAEKDQVLPLTAQRLRLNAHHALGCLELDNERPEKALPQLSAALKLAIHFGSPGSESEESRMGDVAKLLCNFEDAHHWYVAGLELMKQHLLHIEDAPEVLLAIRDGHVYIARLASDLHRFSEAKRNLAEARDYTKRALHISPDSSQNRQGLIGVLLHQGSDCQFRRGTFSCSPEYQRSTWPGSES